MTVNCIVNSQTIFTLYCDTLKIAVKIAKAMSKAETISAPGLPREKPRAQIERITVDDNKGEVMAEFINGKWKD